MCISLSRSCNCCKLLPPTRLCCEEPRPFIFFFRFLSFFLVFSFFSDSISFFSSNLSDEKGQIKLDLKPTLPALLTTMSGVPKGVFFSSPQQIIGEGPTFADNVWNLAISAIAMVAGSPPFSQENCLYFCHKVLGFFFFLFFLSFLFSVLSFFSSFFFILKTEKKISITQTQKDHQNLTISLKDV